MNLTDEQRLFAEHPNEAFLEACPGAGKTLAILERTKCVGRALPPRRGIAVLSFTNKAIEELRERSGAEGIEQLLRHPGFVGTFDAFVRHFLFAPFGVDGLHEQPHVVDSWKTLDVVVRLRRNPFRGPGASLDVFDSMTSAVELNQITHRGLQNHVLQHQGDYERAARALRQSLHRRGHFSAEDARATALQRIRTQPFGASLGRAIAARIHEIVVDEAQDCNPDDIEILTWLKNYGVRVTMVCDLDQSIFEFRNGTRANIEACADTYSDANRLRLTGNFRSSPGICSLAASLRHSPAPDVALGPHRNLEHQIPIRPYAGRAPTADVGAWFAGYAEARGISRAGLIVLAHSDRAARLAAGGRMSAGTGRSKIEMLAKAVSEFWTSTTKHGKNAALSSLERMLLDISGRLEDSESVSRAVRRLGVSPRELRRQALECAMQMPHTCQDTNNDRAAWVESAREVLGALRIPIPAGSTLRRILPNPASGDWSHHLERGNQNIQLRFSTIHNAKGGEYDGVCVVIPPDNWRGFTGDLFAAWSARADHEPKRVIYVGVTRGMRLSALSIPAACLDQCTAILAAADVPHEVCR